MRDGSALEEILDAVSHKQTPHELMLLGTLNASPVWPPIRVILLRMKDRHLAVMEKTSASIEEIRVAQGALAFANELVQFVEEEAPSAYQEYRKKHDPDADPSEDP